jgi:hypothetical protein
MYYETLKKTFFFLLENETPLFYSCLAYEYISLYFALKFIYFTNARIMTK